MVFDPNDSDPAKRFTTIQVGLRNLADLLGDNFGLPTDQAITPTDGGNDTVSVFPSLPDSFILVTVVCGDGNDLVRGTDGQGTGAANYYGGNVLFLAGSGNCTLIGSGGTFSLLKGGSGDCVLIAGSGTNILAGGSGNNQLYGQPQGPGVVPNTIMSIFVGGSGDNFIDIGTVSQGPNLIIGGSLVQTGPHGRNIIVGGLGDETIFAGNATQIGNTLSFILDPTSTGNDLIVAGPGNNQIYGDGGDDTIIGGFFGPVGPSGHVTVHAGSGTNLIIAGNAVLDANNHLVADTTTVGGGTVYGGAGTNTIYAGVGNNIFSSDTGPATYIFSQPTGAEAGAIVSYTITGGSATDTLDFTNTISQNVTLTSDDPTGFAGFTPSSSQFRGTFTGINDLLGSVNGATDLLTGENTAANWSLTTSGFSYTDVGSGRTLDFSNFENLTGGSAADDFVFDDTVTVPGVIDGKGGTDTLDLRAYSTARDITLTELGSTDGFDGTEASVGGGFKNIDQIFASGVPVNPTDTLNGLNAAATWTLDSTNKYQSGGHTLEFAGFPTLNGGSDVDIFNVRAIAVAMTLNGNAGDDFFNVTSDAPTDAGNLDGITAPLVMDAGTGSANRLVISDFGQTANANSNVVLTGTVLSGGIEHFFTINGLPFQRITGLAGPTNNVEIDYAATGGAFTDTALDPTTGKPANDGVLIRGSNTLADAFTVQNTLGGISTTEIQGNGGNDLVTVNVDATKDYNLYFDGGSPTKTKVGDNLVVNDVTRVDKFGIPIPVGSSTLADATKNGGAVIHNLIADTSTTDVNFHRVNPSEIDVAYLDKALGNLDPTAAVATLTKIAAAARIHKDILYRDVEVVKANPDANHSFVQAMFHQALRRDATNADIAAWYKVLITRGQAAVVQGIENLFEALTLVVKDWYTQYLGRNAKPGETSQFVVYLQAGYSEEVVLSRFFNLPEYYQKAGNTMTGYVNLIYQQLLGRAPTTTEMFVALQFVLPKTGRGGVALSLLHSVEYRTNIVLGYFYNTLGRGNPQTAADKREWNLELHNWVYSALSLKTIRIRLESAKEFFDFAD